MQYQHKEYVKLQKIFPIYTKIYI